MLGKPLANAGTVKSKVPPCYGRLHTSCGGRTLSLTCQDLLLFQETRWRWGLSGSAESLKQSIHGDAKGNDAVTVAILVSQRWAGSKQNGKLWLDGQTAQSQVEAGQGYLAATAVG